MQFSVSEHHCQLHGIQSQWAHINSTLNDDPLTTAFLPLVVWFKPIVPVLRFQSQDDPHCSKLESGYLGVHWNIAYKYRAMWTKNSGELKNDKPASSGRSSGCRVKTGTDRVQDGLPQSHVLLASYSPSHWTVTRSRQPAMLYMSYDSTYGALPHVPFQVSTFFLSL